MPYSPNSTMGYPQRRWFLEELSQYKNYGMVRPQLCACHRHLDVHSRSHASARLP